MKHIIGILLVACVHPACNESNDDEPSRPQAGKPASDAGRGGSPNPCLGTACEAQLWPRMALQLGDTSLSTDEVTFVADGLEAPANTQPSCPTGFASTPRAAEFECVAGLSAAPGTKTASVVVRRSGQAEQSWDVELAEHNRCGANIAYVTLNLSGDEVTLAGPKYRSPCLETNAP